MPDNLQPETMSTWMRDVERRLRAMETRNRLQTVQYGAVVEPNTLVTVTDAAYVGAWEFRMGQVIADAVSVRVVVTTQVGTTAQVRLREVQNGWFTDPVTVPAATSEQCAFDWSIPNLDLYLGTPGPLVYVEARRTAGAGNVFVYLPQVVLQAASYDIGATSTGNPRLL